MFSKNAKVLLCVLHTVKQSAPQIVKAAWASISSLKLVTYYTESNQQKAAESKF